MRRVDQCVEPLLEPVGKRATVLYFERRDQHLRDAPESGEILVRSALHRERHRILEHLDSRREQVAQATDLLDRVAAMLEVGLEDLDRRGLSEVADRDALSLSHGDEPRLFQLADRFAEGVAIGVEGRRELALRRQAGASLELATEDPSAQREEDIFGDLGSGHDGAGEPGMVEPK